MTVILLKNRSDDVELNRPDPYEESCEDCQFVPIMGYRNINLPETEHKLQSSEWSGLIVTSQRAVDAIKLVLANCPPSIYSKPVYTVGPTTAHRLKILGFDTVIGEESGNGLSLAELMLKRLEPGSNLLFLAGEVHRRQLPNKLIDAGHLIDTQIVYCTEPDCHVHDSLVRYAKNGDWIVFFSPSHTAPALEFVNSHRNLLKVAAIGPTTKEFLENRGVTVNVTAPDPSAKSLISEIERYVD